MKPRTLATMISGLIAVAPAAAIAGDTPEPMSVSAEGALAAPLGDFSDTTGLGIGALAGFEFAINRRIQLTASAGVIYHFDQDLFGGSFQLTEIPILVGGRVQIGKGVFFYGQLGPLLARLAVSDGVTSDADTNDFVASRFGVGYDATSFAVAAGLMFSNIERPGDSASLIITASVPLARF